MTEHVTIPKETAQALFDALVNAMDLDGADDPIHQA